MILPYFYGNEVVYITTSYLVLSLTFDDSTKLMNKFIYALRDTDEIRKVDRRRKIVYMIDGTTYRFTRNDKKHTDGCIHDSTTTQIGWITFSSLIDSFTTGEPIMKTFNNTLKEALKEKDV